MGAIMKEQNLNDWKEVKLQDICIKMQSGGTPKADNKKYYGGDIPFTKIDDITKSGKYLISTSNTITEDGLKNSSAWKVPKNSILYSMYASLGFLSINKIEVATNQAILNIIPNEKLCQLEYLYYALLDYKKEINKYVSQSTQKNLNAQKVRNFKLNLPPLQEQEKIAEILSNIDDQIEMTQEIITKTEEIKQGLMQELLIKGIGHKEFKEVELNDELYSFPKSWNLLKLKNCCSDFLVPMRNKPKIFEGSIPWCRIEDFNGKYLYTTKSNQFVTPEIVSEMKLKIFPKGTVICSCSATLGICSIAGNELVTNQTFIGIVTNQNDLNNEYLYYLLQFFAKRLQKLSTGTTIAYLPKKKFEDLEIVIPNIDEQNKIVQILSNADEQIINEENYLQKLQEIKKGLMQDLLSGKVRVKIN